MRLKKLISDYGFLIILAIIMIATFIVGYALGKAITKSEMIREHCRDMITESQEAEPSSGAGAVISPAVFRASAAAQDEEQAETEEKTEYINLGEFKLTAYCPCEKCCGQWAYDRPIDTNGNQIIHTASGAIAEAGKTIAVDPSVIPYGTEVIINGHTYIAQDCGSAIQGNRIDIYFDSHSDALEFGIQYAEVIIRK